MSDITFYLAQHGLAVDSSVDSQRPLSNTGSMQTESIARHLCDCEVPVSRVFHSGKLRASQTGEIFTDIFHLDSASAIDTFSANHDILQTVDRLTVDNALYIGHLPHLAKLVSFLVTGSEDSNPVCFSNSAVACMQRTGDDYQLCWYLTPDIVTANLVSDRSTL